MKLRDSAKFLSSIVTTVFLLVLLSLPLGMLPPLGNVLDPGNGIWTSCVERPAESSVVLSGLKSDVTIFRDHWGIPHIYAKFDSDLTFALGYLHAQDRLFQMEMQRRLARGQLAEILGSDYLSTDLFLRTIGLEYGANRTLTAWGTSEHYELLEAYCAGVNTYLGHLEYRDLPIEFKILNYFPRPWTPLDTLSFAKYTSLGLSFSTTDLYVKYIYDSIGPDLFNDLFPSDIPLQIPVVPDYGSYDMTDAWPDPTPQNDQQSGKLNLNCSSLNSDESIVVSDTSSERAFINDPLGITSLLSQGWLGSNNWVVDGTKSSTGKPILCNDAHLPWTVPPVWYEAHLVSQESNWNSYGFVYSGTPAIIAGHNQHCAWGFTNSYPDVIDWFYYVWNPSNPDQYWYNGSWNDVEKIPIKIYVKGAEPLETSLRFTVHGPIAGEEVAPMLTGDYTQDYAIRWGALDGAGNPFEALYEMNHATSINEFEDALQYLDDPTQNTVCADVDGNIAMFAYGHIPIRANGGTGRFPVNGSLDPNEWHEWIGFVPFDELPRSVNPSQHYLASANQKTVGPNYLYHWSSFHAPGYRARRINSLLYSDDNITIEDMKSYQTDIVDVAAQAFVPWILSVAESDSSSDPLLISVIGELENWNCEMNANWSAPTIWRVFLDKFLVNSIGDEFEAHGVSGTEVHRFGSILVPVLEDLARWNATSSYWDDVTTMDHTETLDDILVMTLEETVTTLAESFETNDISQWKWGEHHSASFNHPVSASFSIGPLPASGDCFTINVAGARLPLGNGSGIAEVGPSERAIYDLSNLTLSLTCLPGGQDGRPATRHYTDQLLQLFIPWQYHVTLDVNQDDFPEDQIESTLILVARRP